MCEIEALHLNENYPLMQKFSTGGGAIDAPRGPRNINHGVISGRFIHGVINHLKPTDGCIATMNEIPTKNFIPAQGPLVLRISRKRPQNKKARQALPGCVFRQRYCYNKDHKSKYIDFNSKIKKVLKTQNTCACR